MSSLPTPPPPRVLTREDIERNHRLPPLSKLILEYLSRQPPGRYLASHIGAALACLDSDVAVEAYELRRQRLVLSQVAVDGVPVTLPLATFVIADDVRAAYAPKSPAGQNQNKKGAA